MWQNLTSTRGEHQPDGLAKGIVRKTKEGLRLAVIQSGLNAKWWSHLVCYPCFTAKLREDNGEYQYLLKHGECYIGVKFFAVALVNFVPREPNP